MRTPHQAKRSLKSNIVTLIGVAGAVYLIGSTTDLAEKAWTLLQAYEAVELDELVIAGMAMLVAGLVVSFREIADLKAKVTKLQSVEDRTPTLETLYKEHTDCVIKCVGCGKYRIHGEHWFSPEEFTTRTQQADALGGVCPDCRPPSGD